MSAPTAILHQITVIVERGQADAVAKAAIKAGAPAATIAFARGTGIREKLGLLRVTVSPEKEVITVIVSTDRSDYVADAMAEAGQLKLPGKGILYITPVTKIITYMPSQK